MIRNLFLQLIIVCLTTVCHAQKAYQEAGYMVLDMEGMPDGCGVNRKTEGYLTEGRLSRHELTTTTPYPNFRVSRKFRVSPADVAENGTTNLDSVAVGGTWAGFAGWHTNANTKNLTVSAALANTGCSVYQGKDGTDTPGTWRLPSQKELMLISMMSETLEKGAAETGFVKFNATTNIYYVSASEYLNAGKYYFYGVLWKTRVPCKYDTLPIRSTDIAGTGKNKNFRARCIQDL